MRQRRPMLALAAAAVVIPLSGIVAVSAQGATPTLRDPVKREIAQEIVTSAENSSLNWYEQYDYIENYPDGRGLTAGIVGFTSGTHDMLVLVQNYTKKYPSNRLAKWIDELQEVDGTSEIGPLGDAYMADWKAEAKVPAFQKAQRDEVTREYFDPSVNLAISDKLGPLGQFAYYDAAVMHGFDGLEDIRTVALKAAKTPASGGNETTYLNKFLDARRAEMDKEPAHREFGRVDTAQRVWLQQGNLNLNTPLTWKVYDEEVPFSIPTDPTPHWDVEGTPTSTPTPTTPGTSGLISKGKPATASSVEGAGFEAGKAFDGDATTSRWASKEGVDPQWIQVDLGAGAKVDKVVLKWEAAYAKAYKVQISPDGSAWTTLKEETAGNGGTDEFTGLNGTGRYLRIYGTARGTAYGYSLYEVEAYGTTDGGGSTPTPTATPTSTPTPTPTPTTPTDVLVSKGKPATASSVETAGFEAGKAFDGDATTSRWASKEGVDPQWIQVDLGTGAKVNKVVLKWEAAYAKAYKVQISPDGTAWTTLKEETAGNGGTDEFTGLNGTGRYLRIYGTARGTAYGYSLYEVEAYGTPGEGGGGTNPGTTFTVAAAGDIAGPQCTKRGVKTHIPTDDGYMDSECKHFETFDLAKSMNPAFYITLGDQQYDDGHIEDFNSVYNLTWGQVKANTWPVPGNHETYDQWDNKDPLAYRNYFGSRATPNGKMYYSYDYGNWHFIALNSNGKEDDQVVNDEEQFAWLKADLAANTKQCVVAYMHHPAYSSGSHGSEPATRPFWKILAEANVELVLAGHDHDYERFSPMDASGAASSSGTVEIVSGLGGHEMRDFANIRPNSAKRINTAFGVSRLDFTDNSVTQKFVDINGSVLDSNTITCH